MRNPRKMGRFKVSFEFLRQWQDLLPLMGNFVVTETRSSFAGEVIEYVAFSELFDEIPEGVVPPEYQIVIESNVIPAKIRAVRMESEEERYRAGLLLIRDFGIHSEPLGIAMAMKDIAADALGGK